MITGFDHVHVMAGNAEEVASFFEKIFGGRIFAREQAGGLPVVRMDLYGVNVFIFGTKPGAGQFESGKGLRGVDHIGFKVKDLAKAAEELKKKGARFSIEPSVTPAGVKFAFIDGPDGLRVELVERN